MVSDQLGEQGTRELIDFARRLGLRPQWIRNSGYRMEHFDLTEAKRAEAVKLGAREISSRQLVEIRRSRPPKGDTPIQDARALPCP